MNTQDDTRPIRTISETRHGVRNDIITDGTHYYPLSPTWKSEAWFHASMWDPGVCFENNSLKNFVNELQRRQYTEVANALYSYCYWTLVNVYLTATNPPPINAKVKKTLDDEITHFKIIWETWRKENPTL